MIQKGGIKDTKKDEAAMSLIPENDER